MKEYEISVVCGYDIYDVVNKLVYAGYKLNGFSGRTIRVFGTKPLEERFNVTYVSDGDYYIWN